MYSLTRNWLLGLAISVALAPVSIPANANELTEHLGPVGPTEPILATVGSKRVIAFYEAGGGQCSMHIVVWDGADISGSSAARVRVALDPRQVVHIDTPEHKSLNLQCGQSADTLTIVERNKKLIAGAAQ